MMTPGRMPDWPDLIVPGFLLGLGAYLLEVGPHADSILSGVGEYFFFASLIVGVIAVALVLVQLPVAAARSLMRRLRRTVAILSALLAVSVVISVSCTLAVTREAPRSAESPSPVPSQGSNLLKNGDFSRGLSFWSANSKPGIYIGFPRTETRTIGAKPVAALEVPGNSEAYLEQEVTMPASPAYQLSVGVYRQGDPVVAYVAVASGGKLTELDRFTPSCSADKGCAPDVKRYDLSALAGLTLQVRLGATSTGFSRTTAYFTNALIIPLR